MKNLMMRGSKSIKGIALGFVALGLIAGAQAQEFSSGDKSVALVQLYTSEGCSSCPPADRWLSRLKDQPNLWQDFVPLAFHVDYWDRLGWEDRFARPEYSARQRLHKREDIIRSVYTPGFIVANHEWRQWFSGPRQLPLESVAASIAPEVLTANYQQGDLQVSYGGDPESLILHAAYLGMNLETDVVRGENSGSTLRHDFVVLKHQKWKGNGQWQYSFPAPKAALSEGTDMALAVWVTKPNGVTVLQATGGELVF